MISGESGSDVKSGVSEVLLNFRFQNATGRAQSRAQLHNNVSMRRETGVGNDMFGGVRSEIDGEQQESSEFAASFLAPPNQAFLFRVDLLFKPLRLFSC